MPDASALSIPQNSALPLLLDAVQKCCPDASNDNLLSWVIVIYRSSLLEVSRLHPESYILDVIWAQLRSINANPTSLQLHDVLHAVKAVHQVNLTTLATLPQQPSCSHQYSLHECNQHAALAFDQLVLTSQAGEIRRDTRPTSAKSLTHSTDTSSTTGAPSFSSASSSAVTEKPSFSPSWLRNRCTELPPSPTPITPAEIALSVLTLLTDPTLSDTHIQGHLFDAFHGDFDAVVDVLTRRSLISSHADAVLADCSHAAQLELSALHPRGEGSSRRGRGRRRGAKGRNRLNGSDLDALPAMPEWGASAFEEREKAFPGVQLERDAVIGEVDRVGLPKGASREIGKGYEEIFIPPPLQTPVKGGLVQVTDALSDHPELLTAMKGVTTLNRLQSIVFPVAFKSQENLLVCAPTGAGKTNVALLTIFREIVAVKCRQQRAFKVVYVAPMKALAAEVTDKFSRRLAPLGLLVREFTGDMSLTRFEALSTHVLVTTPEKWDVVTRKSGSDLSEAVTLFIIDEIHLLHDDRGAVLESIVARTLRLSETAQRQIRLVGLSATLPNYADVGAFMRVNPEKGLFHFDGSHRPVPLSQTFIGISEGGTSNSSEARRKREGKMHEMAWKKVKDSLMRGHQAMIFVHSRKGTATAAREMIFRAAQDVCEDLFLGKDGQSSNPGNSSSVRTKNSRDEDGATLPSWAVKEISKSKSSDIRELCSRGVGIHNAGLPRPDRKLVEKLFSEGVIKLLCCTATLAWGINLPARTVVIMGTEVYDAQKGGFVQLGMLDVMQIFGRAGRPQFDTEGEGIIITMHEHLGKYLSLLTSSIPIESTLSASASRLADHLNAEIVSGTVSSIGEGVRWLSYTYLSVRMPQNPLVYGIDRKEVEKDEGLHSRRAMLVQQASKALDDSRMCRYDTRSGVIAPTDLGRVASHFYVSHETIELWSELLKTFSSQAPSSDEEMYAIVIHAISCATEFEQMRSRQEEEEELYKLQKDACPIPCKSGSETREGKVSILLQAHISRAYIRMSDLSYIVQSATRLLRAFFEICLNRGIPSLSLAALELARASESRIWPFQHPLWQFTYLTRRERGLLVQPETIAMIEEGGDNYDVNALRRMSMQELSVLIRAPKMAQTVQKVLKAIPTLDIEKATVAPLNRTLLFFQICLFPNFRWNDSLHGNVEHWWLWIEDLTENRVYRSQKVLLTKQQVQAFNQDVHEGSQGLKKTLNFSLLVPVFDPPSPEYWIRVESDRWHTGSSCAKALSIDISLLPQEKEISTKLLDLKPLPLQSCLRPKETAIFERGMTHFNRIQTQAFHIAKNSNENILISVPHGSGEWTIAELAILRALHVRKGATVVCIAASVGTLTYWKKSLMKFKHVTGGRIETLGAKHIDSGKEGLNGVDIIMASPIEWYKYTQFWDDDLLMDSVSLVVFHEMHLLSSVDNVEIELIASRLRRMNHTKRGMPNGPDRTYTRVVAVCGRCPNATQFGEWLGVSRKKGMFCFGSDVREVSCELHVLGVAGDRHTSRMHSMNRPLYSMILRHSARKPVIIFVASRRQSLLTAQDLLRMASFDGKPKMFVATANPDEIVIKHARVLRDIALRQSVANGIGLYHASMTGAECYAVEELFEGGHIQILISTFDMARHLNVACHQVIIKGTESYQEKEGRYEDIPVSDVLNMIGKAGRPGTNLGRCYAVVFVHEPKQTLMKKLLHEPLCIESMFLHSDISEFLLHEIMASRVHSIEDAVRWLSWSFMFQRILSNPGFYGLTKKLHLDGHRSSSQMPSNPAENMKGERTEMRLKFCEGIINEAVEKLKLNGCISTNEQGLIELLEASPAPVI